MSLPVKLPEAISETTEEEIEGTNKSELQETEGSQSLARLVLRALRRDRIALFGLGVIVLIVFVAIFAKYIAPYNPDLQQLSGNLLPPSWTHLLGQDELGRDILSRIIFGSRVSLEVGASVVSVSVLIGVVLGSLSGYYGGKVDIVIMRFVDIFLSFPGIILAVGAVAIIGPGLKNVIIALIIINWPGYTRVMRGEVLRIKQNPYILASRGMGASDSWILTKTHHSRCNFAAGYLGHNWIWLGGFGGSGVEFSWLGSSASHTKLGRNGFRRDIIRPSGSIHCSFRRTGDSDHSPLFQHVGRRSSGRTRSIFENLEFLRA